MSSPLSRAAAALLLFGVASMAAGQAPGPIAGEYLVVVDTRNADVQAVAADLRATTGATVEVVVPKIGLIKMTMPKAANAKFADAATAAAAAKAGVVAVEPNGRMEWCEEPKPRTAAPRTAAGGGSWAATPNDPMFSLQWHFNSMAAKPAWDLDTSTNVIVAIADSGIHLNHSDLVTRWHINPDEIPANLIDDDGNGYIDDVRGWDCFEDDNDPGCELYNPGTGNEWEAHGSHVSGCAGAAGNNLNGVTGTCWNVSMIPLRVGDGFGPDLDDAAEAIVYAADNGAKVVNCSFGASFGEATLRAAVQYAATFDVLVVVAAGNSGLDIDMFPYYPASLDEPNVLTVAALDRLDARRLAWFSNYGATSVDIATPGVEILSTVPGPSATVLFDDYQEFSGTSMASPITAGAAALVWGYEPSLTSAEVKQILIDTADDFTQLNGLCVADGRLNLFKAMQAAVPPPPPSDPPTIGTIDAVTVECTGDQNLVELETIIDDPDTATLSVTWRVDGIVRKTQANLAQGDTVTFEYDYPDGPHDVIAEVYDGDTRVQSGTTVTVEDTTSPILVVAADVTVSVDPGEIVATGVDLGTPDVDDLCDGDPVLANSAPNAFKLGVTTVRWTATDKDGNVAEALQKVTVTNEAPNADAGINQTKTTTGNSAQATLDGTGSNDPNEHDLTYAWTAPGATFDDASSPTPVGTFPIGTTTATVTVTDEAGETDSATVQVKVTKRDTVEYRYAGAIANYYATLGNYFGYYAAISGNDMNSYAGYESAIYAYLMGEYAGHSLKYGVSQTRDEALGDYMTFRYYQYLYSQYGSQSLFAAFNESGNLYALYAAIYDYYANYYALGDLSE